MRQIELTDTHLRFKFKYHPDIIAQVKNLGMRWKPASKKNPGTGKYWYAKLSRMLTRNFAATFPEFTQDLAPYMPTIPPVWGLYTPSSYLMKHQTKAAIKAITRNRYGFFHDTGTGKTLLGLELIKQKQVKTLVVCPLGIVELAWMEDRRDWTPEINAVNLWALKQKEKNKGGRKALEDAIDNCELAIINFESFRIMKDRLLDRGFNMLLVDESAKVKDSRSLTTEALIEFSEWVDYCYLFSGCPAPNGEEEYWSQGRMIDPNVFGASYFVFRARYFYSTGYEGFKWKLKKEIREEFLEKLAEISEVVEKRDVLDLPEETFNVRKVYLDTSERKAYEQMRKHLVIEFQDTEVLAVNSGVKLMKLREGTSGFYLDQEKRVIKVGESKLKELMELLEEIGDHQVIIWTNFHHEADQIENKLGRNYGRVDGTISKLEIKEQTIQEFRSGGLQYLIAHPGSVRHGHRLEICTYQIFYSQSHSYEFFYQQIGRSMRKGQTEPVTYYFLIADRSVDEVIYKALQVKGSVVEAVFKYIKGRGGRG